MVTVCKLRRPGQGGGGPGPQAPDLPLETSYFLLHSWDRHSALQEHSGCARVEMALAVVPLSWLFARAFLSHSSIRCFPLFQHLLFSAQRCIGDEGPYKGNSDLLRHRYLKVLEMKGILFRGFFPFFLKWPGCVAGALGVMILSLSWVPTVS